MLLLQLINFHFLLDKLCFRRINFSVETISQHQTARVKWLIVSRKGSMIGLLSGSKGE